MKRILCRLCLLCGLCAAFLLSPLPAVAEESCSDEIQSLEDAVEKHKPSASRGEEEQTEILLAGAQLEVLCDEFDEWDVGTPENQRIKDESIATLRTTCTNQDGLLVLEGEAVVIAP